MKTRFGLTFGIVLMLVAIVLLLSAAGVIPHYISDIIISWQFLLLIVGVKLLLMGSYIAGAVVSIFSSYFIIPRIYHEAGLIMPVSKENLLTILIASLLIVCAIMSIIISSKWMPKTRSFFEISKDKKGSPEISCAFGEISHTIIERPYKDSAVTTAFGELNLNMGNTVLPEGDSFLKVNNAFGETVISVPESWVVETSVRSVFGSFEDNRIDVPIGGNRRLFIQGGNAFGCIRLKSVRDNSVNVAQETSPEAETIETISVKQNNRVHVITLDELFYIQADGDYVTLATSKGNFMKEQTMKYFQGALPADRFIRIHRSYIVNIAEISSVDSRGKEVYYVILKNGTSLRASASGYQELRQRLEI